MQNLRLYICINNKSPYQISDEVLASKFCLSVSVLVSKKECMKVVLLLFEHQFLGNVQVSQILN